MKLRLILFLFSFLLSCKQEDSNLNRPQQESEVGRYQIVVMSQDFSILLDSKTGQTWQLSKWQADKYRTITLWNEIPFGDTSIADIVVDESQKTKSRAELVKMWDEADVALTKKYKDFYKYKPAIKDKLKNDLKWNSIREQLNSDSEGMKAKGITHQSVMEEIYQSLKEKEHPSVN